MAGVSCNPQLASPAWGNKERRAMTEQRGIDRRTFLKVAGAGAIGTVAAVEGLGPVLGGAASEALAANPKRGGKITISTVDTPVNMDPADAELYASLQVYDNMFSKLINVTADYKFVPNLAHSWHRETATTWIVDLVDNAVFHNGAHLTAHDVKFSMDRVKSHPNGVFFSAFKSTEVVNKYRVRFHLNHPFGAFEAGLAMFSEIVNPNAVTHSNPKLHPIGSGPYRMTEWVQNDHVTLTRWQHYFKKNKPYLDEVVFRAIGDDTVRLTGLQTGQLAWIQQVPPQKTTALLRSSQIKSSPGRPYLPYFFMLNCAKPPFNDKRVRQAIAWAVDRQEFEKLVWFGTAVPATEGVSLPSPWYSGVDPYKGAPDPEKAKHLLKQAGRSNLVVNFANQPNVQATQRYGVILKSQLAKVGITLNIQNFAPAQWFEELSSGRYQITETYWSASLDPAQLYFPLTYSNSPWNFPKIKSAAIDAALAKFVYTSDQKARKTAYPEVVRAVAEEAPVVFLNNQIQRYWKEPALQNAGPLPSLEIKVEDWWLKR
jgi:peptide/nickel transport system substrate-binding protein